MNKTPQELYNERKKRVADAIELKVPDRVPVLANFRFFASKYIGMTSEEVFYDYEKWMEANKKTILDFRPDMYHGPMKSSGAAFETLGLKQLQWPGHGVSPQHSQQYVEDEYMKSDEYDAFLDDPSDFIIRTLMPRVYESLRPFKKLPPLKSFFSGYKSAGLFSKFGDPEVREAFEALLKAGDETVKFSAGMKSFDGEMKRLGFPLLAKSHVNTAFDWIGDVARGTRGVMLDMYRQPDKLLAAIEKISPLIIDQAVSAAKAGDNPRVYITLHKGADGFMSPDQFKTFYWPSLKKLMLALIDEDLNPCPFFEGGYNTRLEHLNELPRGKVLAQFENTDLLRAKEIVGNNMCICGNVPMSLLHAGTPQEVKDYCKKLIDVVGKDGGLIIAPKSVLDDAKPENVRAMIAFTKEYGVYN